MYQDKYYVLKDSGTYSNMLEAYGLALLLSRLLRQERSVDIIDRGMYYEISLKRPITEEMVGNCRYIDLFRYIKTKGDDADIPDSIDYEFEANRAKLFNEERKEQSLKLKEARSKLDKKAYKAYSLKLKQQLDNSENKPRDDWDILQALNPSKLKALDTYKTVFQNVYNNKSNYKEIVKHVLMLYASPFQNQDEVEKSLKKLIRSGELRDIVEVNAVQAVNPDKVKGAASTKANSISPGPIKAFWLREYVKLAGMFSGMIVKDIKIGPKKWDAKIYVLDLKNMNYSMHTSVYKNLKPIVTGMTAVRLDITMLLLLCKTLIEHSENYIDEELSKRKHADSYVSGLYTVYLKNMGKAYSPTNISYLETPDFIAFNNKEEAGKWINIIDDHLDVIKNIRISASKSDETNSILKMLQNYRQFISGSNIEYFFDFIVEYSEFLMSKISKEEYYVRPFSLSCMEVFLKEMNYGEILKNQGFCNIAKAIRNSTISAQYAKDKDDGIKYEIRYGMALDLKRKAPYKDQFIQYLSDFIASYNAEAARVAEKHPELKGTHKLRATIKTQDLEDIIELIDKYDDCTTIAKLLCAYGYSLERKELDDQMSKVSEEDDVDDE
ncbi:hypothetical protein [Clostridium thermosuccinogenes]|uniref:hypothetical protein n=1 Tax=Clostridium thermosuccinogenes TaxID=84032 RepID=UPI000CCC4C29|nr:hypothetical protein [Pseudoclostridium thermosuccinogenes]PNT91008.1 hypothetical protein CDQ83_14380 [Pseudoclostridium thermosuccinogenes]